MKKIKILVPTIALSASLSAGALMGFVKAESNRHNDLITIDWGVYQNIGGTVVDPTYPIDEGTLWKNLTHNQIAKATPSDGYTFSGWSTSSTELVPVGESTPIMSGMHIYAVFAQDISKATIPSSITIQPSKSLNVAMTWPAGQAIDNINVVWSCDDTDITITDKTKNGCTITAGSITTAKTVELIATISSGFNTKELECSVTINPQIIPVTSVKIQIEKMIFIEGQSMEAQALPGCDILPSAATSKDLTWSSSDTSIFTINSSTQKVVPVKVGHAYLNVCSTQYPTVCDRIIVSVEKAPTVAPTGVQFLPQTPSELMLGEKPYPCLHDFLTFTWPEGKSTGDTRIIWKSSDPKQIPVSNEGVVKCIYKDNETDNPVKITAISAANQKISAEWNITPLSNGWDVTIKSEPETGIFASDPIMLFNDKIEYNFKAQWGLNSFKQINSVDVFETDSTDRKLICSVSGINLSTGFELSKDQIKQMVDIKKIEIVANAVDAYNVNTICGEGVVDATVQTAATSGDAIIINCSLLGGDYESLNLDKCIVTNKSTGAVIAATKKLTGGNKLEITLNDDIRRAGEINVELSASTARETYKNITITGDENANGRILNAIVGDDILIKIMMPDTHTLNLDKPTVENPETVGTNIVIGGQTHYSDEFAYVESDRNTCVLTIPKNLVPAGSTDSIQVNLISVGRTINSTVTLDDGGLTAYEVTYNKADGEFTVVFTAASEHQRLSAYNTHVDLTGVPGMGTSLGIIFQYYPTKIVIAMDDPSIRNYLLPLRGDDWNACTLQIHAFSENI